MLQALSLWITDNIAVFGYSAVVFLMALESANIPIPSEVVLPFAGFLVSKGQLNFHGAAFAGAFGCLLGSVASYAIGKKLGRKFIQKHGKWFFIGPTHFARGDAWMKKYGNAASFFSRLLPVVRTFISLIAGVWEAAFWAFAVLSFVGSLLWSYLLVYIGFVLGENWAILRPIWEKFDIAIVGVIILAVVGYAAYHWKKTSSTT